MARLSERRFAFLLGIPGCGKSEIYRRLSNRLTENQVVEECERYDDYPILWEYFQDNGPKTRPADDGGYVVLDDTLWDDVLTDLNDTILAQAQPGELTFVEFARADNRSALENFSDEVLDRSIILYVYCPFDEAWRRNVERHENQGEGGTDDHLVSREEMEETYGEDDHEQLLSDPPIPAVRIDNDENSLDKLESEIDRVYDPIRNYLTDGSTHS